jgi:threonine aldolase
MLATGPDKIRAVTHLDVSRELIEQAIRVFRQVCSAAAG